MRQLARAWAVGVWLAVAARGGGPVSVASVDALHEALRGLGPGATVVLADGEYRTARPIRIEGRRGTEEAPIVLRAEHRGKAVISGAAGFVVKNCEHLALEGLVFVHDADQQAVQLVNCHQVRVSRNTFRLTERAKPRHWEHWVTVDGAYSGLNRIDHNLFEHKGNRGSHVFVRGDDNALVCSQRDRVDHNRFRDVIFANGENGHETIRTGGNDLGAVGRSSFTIIEDNLLENCSGEDEIMSLKSSDNVVRRNTLVNCRGAINLRLGNRDEVAENMVIATEAGPGYGGVRLEGFEHRVVSNYFRGLTGTRHEAPLALPPGTFATPTTDQIGGKYKDNTAVPPTHCVIAGNTWVDCSALQLGYPPDKERPCLPSNCAFVSNTVVRTQPRRSPLLDVGLIRDLRARDNLALGFGSAPTNEWAAWFRFEATAAHPAPDSPRPLTAKDVGPDAP